MRGAGLLCLAWSRQTRHATCTLYKCVIEAVVLASRPLVRTHGEYASGKKTSPANRALGSGHAVLGYALRTAELELQSIGLFPGDL